MPQMAPILWLPLFILFTILWTQINFLSYFNPSKILQAPSQAQSIKKSNPWLW